jgi:hypothetical protein
MSIDSPFLAAIPDEEPAGFRFGSSFNPEMPSSPGQYGNQWNVSFNPLIERLIHDGRCRTLRGRQS